jgi:hypothetical protein
VPIIVTDPAPGNLFGPGSTVVVRTDLVGPIADPSWVVTLIGTDNETPIADDGYTVSNVHTDSLHQFLRARIFPWVNRYFQHGAAGRLHVQLFSGASQVEETSVNITLDAQGAPLMALQQYIADGKAIPTALSAQIQEIEDDTESLVSNWANYVSVTLPSLQTMLELITAGLQVVVESPAGMLTMAVGEFLSGKTLDQIVVVEASGGVTCSPIDVTIPTGGVLYGLIVRCTTIPPWYAFTSPGQNWTPRNLATLTLTRGGNIFHRVGIHTPEWTVYPVPGVLALPVSGGVPVTPPEYNVRVDWGEGVCGELLAMVLP